MPRRKKNRLFSAKKDKQTGCLVEAVDKKEAEKRVKERQGWTKFTLKDLGPA